MKLIQLDDRLKNIDHIPVIVFFIRTMGVAVLMGMALRVFSRPSLAVRLRPLHKSYFSL